MIISVIIQNMKTSPLPAPIYSIESPNTALLHRQQSWTQFCCSRIWSSHVTDKVWNGHWTKLHHGISDPAYAYVYVLKISCYIACIGAHNMHTYIQCICIPQNAYVSMCMYCMHVYVCVHMYTPKCICQYRMYCLYVYVCVHM